MAAPLRLGLTFLLIATPALARVETLADRGHQLADQLCARCHVTAPSDRAGWTDAPSFPSIAARPGMTAARLRAEIGKPHIDMLYSARPANEASALAAYIMTLKDH